MIYNSVAELLLSFVINSTMGFGVAWCLDRVLRTHAKNRLWIWNLSLGAALGLSILSHLPNTKLQCLLTQPSALYVNHFFQGTYSFCLATLISWCWFCSASLGLLTWGLRVRRIRRVLQARTPFHDPRVLRALEHARDALGIRRPIHLSLHSEFRSPVALGTHEICLSPNALNLDELHLQAIFGHELTHTERKDHLKTPLFALLRSLFWFAPLWSLFENARAHYVEEICDQSGARASGTPRNMASALVAVAQSGKGQKHLLPGLNGCKRGLPRRVQALLLESSNSPLAQARTLLCLGIGATALVLFQALAPPLTMSVSDSSCAKVASAD